MEEVLGEFGVPLDGLFSSVRTSETNLGNFICDIMVNHYRDKNITQHSISKLLSSTGGCYRFRFGFAQFRNSALRQNTSTWSIQVT